MGNLGFFQQPTPDALVLSILCDFKGKDELEILIYLLKRLVELNSEDEYKLGKYMLMLETLSSNRDLEEKLMQLYLSDVKKNLPPYII